MIKGTEEIQKCLCDLSTWRHAGGGRGTLEILSDSSRELAKLFKILICKKKTKNLNQDRKLKEVMMHLSNTRNVDPSKKRVGSENVHPTKQKYQHSATQCPIVLTFFLCKVTICMSNVCTMFIYNEGLRWSLAPSSPPPPIYQ